MNLTYEWRPEEWREALLLASAGPRRPSRPLMMYGVVGIMSMGAMGELINAVRTSSQVDYGGSVMPLVLFAASIVVALQIYTRAVSRTRSLRPLLPMPAGPQRMVLAEDGWQSHGAGESEDVRSWEEFSEQRRGKRTMIMVGQGSAFAALPLRVLNAAQGGRLHRLLLRKIYRVDRREYA